MPIHGPPKLVFLSVQHRVHQIKLGGGGVCTNCLNLPLKANVPNLASVKIASNFTLSHNLGPVGRAGDVVGFDGVMPPVWKDIKLDITYLNIHIIVPNNYVWVILLKKTI